MVHLYPLVFWSVGLIYCFQTRPLFCLDVFFTRLNVGALTATSSPFQREKTNYNMHQSATTAKVEFMCSYLNMA